MLRLALALLVVAAVVHAQTANDCYTTYSNGLTAAVQDGSKCTTLFISFNQCITNYIAGLRLKRINIRERKYFLYALANLGNNNAAESASAVLGTVASANTDCDFSQCMFPA